MKYTFEIMNEYEDAFKGIYVYSVSEDKKLMVDFVAREELEDAQKQVNEAYQRGYDKGYADKTNNDEVCDGLAKDIYQRGLDDAWEAARKIVTWPARSLVNSDTFDLDPGENIFTKYSASEAIEKLKAYEEQKADDEIKVGDEVKHKEYKNRFVVTKMQNGYIYGISKDGSWNNFRNDGSFVKTGRHFEIGKILEAMKECSSV